MPDFYYYRVTMVTDYLAISTTVSLDLPEEVGNLSAEAWRQAVVEADAMIEYEMGKKLAYRANEISVVLLLDDEEIHLEEGELVNA